MKKNRKKSVVVLLCLMVFAVVAPTASADLNTEQPGETSGCITVFGTDICEYWDSQVTDPVRLASAASAGNAVRQAFVPNNYDKVYTSTVDCTWLAGNQKVDFYYRQGHVRFGTIDEHHDGPLGYWCSKFGKYTGAEARTSGFYNYKNHGPYSGAFTKRRFRARICAEVAKVWCPTEVRVYLRTYVRDTGSFCHFSAARYISQHTDRTHFQHACAYRKNGAWNWYYVKT